MEFVAAFRLGLSASLLVDNLSFSSNTQYMAVAHHESLVLSAFPDDSDILAQLSANIVPQSSSSEKNLPLLQSHRISFEGTEKHGKSEFKVLSHVWCEPEHGTPFLAVATAVGLQFCEPSRGTSLRFFENDSPRDSEIPMLYRSLTFVPGHDIVISGDDSGSLNVFASLEGNIVHCKRFPVSESPIVAAGVGRASSGEYVLSTADADGLIGVWTVLGQELDQYISIASKGDTPTSMFIRDAFLFVAYGSGVIRVYDIDDDGSLRCEVAAHSRWINGLCPHPELPLFLSCAEDGCFGIWKIHAPSSTDSLVTLVDMLSEGDRFSTGVCFAGPHLDFVCTAAYDSEVVRLYRLTSESSSRS